MFLAGTRTAREHWTHMVPPRVIPAGNFVDPFEALTYPGTD
jgi:hypothetical protein